MKKEKKSTGTKAQSNEAKPKALPRSLPSQQWLSESSQGAVAAEAEGSPSASGGGGGSPTGGPPDPCEENKYKPSGDLLELKIKRQKDIKVITIDPDFKFGATDYLVIPWPGLFEILCDKTNWRPRAKDHIFQIHFYAGSPPKPLSLAQINATTDCNILKQMLNDVEKLAPTGGISGVGADWVPDTFVESHEMVHASLLRISAHARFDTFKATIDGLSVPCSKDPAALQPKIDAAKEAFKDGVEKDRKDISKHKPPKAFIDGSTAACQSFIDAIKARRAALKCP